MLFCSCHDYYYVPGFDFSNFNHTPLSKLARAVKKQDVEKINRIVKQGNIDLEYYDPEYGNTILMYAVAHDLDKSVEELLKLGANPNKLSRYSPDEQQTTPLLVACTSHYKKHYSDTKVLKLLIKYGGNVNFIVDGKVKIDIDIEHPYRNTPLLEASGGLNNEGLELIKVLVEAGANINDYKYPEEYGPITSAIIQKNMKIARYFIIDRKAEIPEYCFEQIDGTKLTITDLINFKEGQPNFEKGSENYKIGQEIIDYLKSIGSR